jgi:hypothetical protein
VSAQYTYSLVENVTANSHSNLRLEALTSIPENLSFILPWLSISVYVLFVTPSTLQETTSTETIPLKPGIKV